VFFRFAPATGEAFVTDVPAPMSVDLGHRAQQRAAFGWRQAQDAFV
jgi:hypothetical protein